METEIHKLLFDYDSRNLATKEERAIYELLKVVIRQQKEIESLEEHVLKLRVRW